MSGPGCAGGRHVPATTGVMTRRWAALVVTLAIAVGAAAAGAASSGWPRVTSPRSASTTTAASGSRRACFARLGGGAQLAQSVEHLHGKEGVAGSSPALGLAP